jgi:hypothetical protein
MKIIIYLALLCVLISSCNESSTAVVQETISADSALTASIPNDSIAERKLIEVIKKITPSAFPDATIEIQLKKDLDPQHSMIIYTVTDGVSFSKYLMTFSNGAYRDYEVLEQSSDADYSVTHYRYILLRDSNSCIFTTVHYQESAADKNVLAQDPDYFKEGYNFENVAIRTDSTIIKLNISESGSIIRDTLK